MAGVTKLSMKNISINSASKIQNLIRQKCRKIDTKIKNDILIFLNLEINSNGINLLEDNDKSRFKFNLLSKCLTSCLELEISKKTESILNSVLSLLSNIKTLKALKTACKKIDTLVNKNIALESESINNSELESLVILFLQYVYQVLYLEYSNFYHCYLFPSGDPDYKDIKQGNIGDCYLLAGLSSLCQTSKGKKAIKKCFINRDTINEDSFVNISLFQAVLSVANLQKSIDRSGKIHTKAGQLPIRIRVDRGNKIIFTIPKDSIKFSYALGDALWVKFLEKAFELYRIDKSVSSKCTYKFIKDYIQMWNNPSSKFLDSGTSDIVITAIAGSTSYAIKLAEVGQKSPLDDYSLNELAIYNTIKKKLSKGLAVTAGKKGTSTDDRHMYSILAVGESADARDYIKLKLYNPHGFKVIVGLHEFAKDFNEINVESSKH